MIDEKRGLTAHSEKRDVAELRQFREKACRIAPELPEMPADPAGFYGRRRIFHVSFH
jgi:hypothetical protein